MGSRCGNSNNIPSKSSSFSLFLIREYFLCSQELQKELSHITLSDTSNDFFQDQLQNLPQNYFNMTHKFFYI